MTSQNTKKIISMMAVGGLTLSGADQIARNPNIDSWHTEWQPLSRLPGCCVRASLPAHC